ncbi:MAG: tRNA uridine-5-carboxymethylaminomethyl(34) synthesis GTPase MnmE [bacterium]|nr:tRNA uridine-5-carboxymethylaminomethyl(34) synthesis GTPase MnmE [bacterium]
MKATTVLSDTITAIATPPGEGGLAVIRISGGQAISILDKIFISQHEKCVAKMTTHKLYHGAMKEGVVSGEEVLAAIMRAPHSYTGEDVVEIFAHGGVLVSKGIVQSIVRQGARLAEPGEFTKRAFLNGRIDLSQAEAVADVISAKTERALKIGLNQLDGSLAKKIKSIQNRIMDIIAQLEANIDYAEEEIENISTKQLRKRIEENANNIEDLIRTYEQGRVIKNGAIVAIVGRPNVGKSSLLNCLLKEEKAIVTAIPGTTRDVIEEVINIQGIPVRLMDTAGVRNSTGIIETIGLKRTTQAIKKADVLLWVIDGSKDFDKKTRDMLRKTKGKTVIAVINKRDLPQRVRKEDLNILAKYPIVHISARTGRGLKELEEVIAKQALHNSAGQSEMLIITSQRQFECLRKAKTSLAKALKSLDNDLSPEFIALDLRKSLSFIGELVGEAINEDILHIIFSKFCVGK